MQLRFSRARVLSAVLAVGGIVVASNGLGACAAMGFQATSGALDFCFLFDCTDGIFGGLFDPCSPILSRPGNPGFVSQDPLKEPGAYAPLFTDCVTQPNP